MTDSSLARRSTSAPANTAALTPDEAVDALASILARHEPYQAALAQFERAIRLHAEATAQLGSMEADRLAIDSHDGDGQREALNRAVAAEIAGTPRAEPGQAATAAAIEAARLRCRALAEARETARRAAEGVRTTMAISFAAAHVAPGIKARAHDLTIRLAELSREASALAIEVSELADAGLPSVAWTPAMALGLSSEPYAAVNIALRQGVEAGVVTHAELVAAYGGDPAHDAALRGLIL